MLTLNDGRAELWQWDTGRTLAVDADCSQVHFSNKVFGRSIDVDVVDGAAIIPDVLLQTAKELNVWAFVGTAENGYTKISKTFKVNRRNKPADYVFTPTEQMTLQTIQRQIGDLADLTTEAKDTLVAAINEAARTGGGGAGIVIDSTLTQSGQAADAAVVGNRLSALSEEIVNKSGADYTFLNGLKYYACGDSIVDMQGTLAAPETFGASGYSTDLQGRSIGEVTVEGYVTAIERRYGLVATNYGKGGHTLVGDYVTLAAKDYSDVALVTIAYGVNDARTGVPLGTVNSTDTTTFAGAMNQLLRKIYTDNPECRVLVLSPMQRLTVTDFGIATPNANGNYLIDFVNMCKAIAEKRSTAFLDQYRCTGINQTNLYYYTVEGVHPVNQGFARIRNAVIGILDELFALEYEPIGVMTNTGDTEPEEPGTGGGGDVTPPGEDTGATEVEVVSRLTKNGYYYDGYQSVTGKNIYKGIEVPLIELIDGKTYTLETYTERNTHGRFAAVSVDENAKAGTYLSGSASSTGNWVFTAVAEGVYKAVLTFVAGTSTVKVDGVPTKCLYLSFGCLNDYASQAKLSYV